MRRSYGCGQVVKTVLGSHFGVFGTSPILGFLFRGWIEMIGMTGPAPDEQRIQGAVGFVGAEAYQPRDFDPWP